MGDDPLGDDKVLPVAFGVFVGLWLFVISVGIIAALVLVAVRVAQSH